MKGELDMSEAKETQELKEKSMSRRGLLKTAGLAGAAAMVFGLATKTDAATGKTYPQVKVMNLRDIKEGVPIKFDYPLIGRKSVLVDCGCAVEGGIGPNRSIVAYSMFCTHLGCSIEYNAEKQNMVCECHQSVYDPRESGRIVEGPAPSSLPMVNLDIDSATGDVYAIGVSGLIYGLRNNLLDGEEVR